MRAKSILMAAALLLGACDADGAVTASNDAGGADAGPRTVTAAQVTVAPLAASFDGANVQVALEQIVAALAALADVPSAVALLEGRVAALEGATGPTEPTAAEVPFDDAATSTPGSSVQLFGEALDGVVDGLAAKVTDLDAWRATADEGIGANTQAASTTAEAVAGLQEAVSLQSWSGNIAIEAAPVVVDPIFLWEDFGPGLTVHDGLQIVWRHVEAIREWHAEQLVAPLCLPDMTSLAAGAHLCVDKARTGMTGWASASSNCRFQGKRLCTASEFILYCKLSASLEPIGPGLNDGIPDPEWVEGVLGTTQPLVAALHGADCDQMVTHPMKLTIGDPEHYRCCKDPRPDAEPLPAPTSLPEIKDLP